MKKRSLLAVAVVVAMLSVVVATTAGADGGCTQGCTPGYWKQEHHFGSWVGYAPLDDFDTTFGGDWFDPDITLLDALKAKGPGSELLRQGVAALLNAANPDVSYPEDNPATVIFWVAYALDNGDYSWGGFYADWNELGCPLGRAELDD